MRFTIRDLLAFPFLAVASIPVVVTMTYFGMTAFPQFTEHTVEIRDWFIAKGVPVDFAGSHIVFYVMQIPTIILLTCLAIVLFSVRSRICDFAAVVFLAALPFVDAMNVGWAYLNTQWLTAMTVVAIVLIYVGARRWIPNPEPSHRRLVSSATILGLVIAFSIATWSYVA